MKQWHVIVLAVFGAGLVVGLMLVLHAARGPTWEGRTVQSWVEDFRLIGGDGHKRAVGAIRAMGTNSIPALVELLCAEDSGFKSSAKAWLPSTLLPKSAGIADSVHHWRAQTGLEALGPLAVPAMLELLRDTNVAARAKAVLMTIGADGLPALIPALSSGDHRIRVDAIRAVGWLRHEAEAAVPSLLVALKDEDKEIREASATALHFISPDAARQAGLRWERTVTKRMPSGRLESQVIFDWSETSSPPRSVPAPH